MARKPLRATPNDGVTIPLDTALRNADDNFIELYAGGGGGEGGAVASVNGETGVVVLDKSDIGLGNVDNTSDSTKNAAAVTLTNKTLTSPVINAPTGIVKADVGLGNVDNTSDASKPVSTSTQTALDLKAPLASPSFTGAPAAPTAAAATNTTQIATTAFVRTEVANLVASSPGALDTLDELAAALGDDANFSSTVTTALAGKQPLDSDLTAIAAISPSNDDIIQRKAGAWTNRTVAQVKADLFTIADQTVLGNISGGSSVPSALTATQLAQLVSGASSTWAARGSGSVVGEIKRITDVGPTGGTRMMWDGTYWRLIAPLDIIFDTTLATGTASTSEQILKQATIPAGLLRAGRTFVIRTVWAKDGTTDAYSNARIRIGAAGTTADALLWNIALLTAGNRSGATDLWLFPSSATQLRVFANQNIGTNAIVSWPNGGSAVAYPTNTTISDIDANALVVSASVQMAGTSNLGQVAHLAVELRP